MGSNQYYEQLIKRVLDLSESHVWDSAVNEWEIVDCEEDDEASTSCVCGKEDLRYLYTIRNRVNHNELFPIGSTCIQKFDREDLDFELSAYRDMFNLLHAVQRGEFIELNSNYFSRNLLLYLFENGVLKPNKYNDYDEEVDYQFMLDMFNKRNKDNISDGQHRKIRAIIKFDILPFVKSKIAINN